MSSRNKHSPGKQNETDIDRRIDEWRQEVGE
jgi:hypothetical protein